MAYFNQVKDRYSAMDYRMNNAYQRVSDLTLSSGVPLP